MSKPVVAIVGRPNVGKSALFNRLAGQRLAVVDDVAGTTRDRLYAESDWIGVQFIIVDTGGIDPTAVTRGREPLSIGSAEFIEQIREQAQQAVSDADVVMFVVDVESGVTPADREVATILRRSQRKDGDRLEPPVLLVVNKVDSVKRRDNLAEFYELGMGDPHPVSAVHGSGTGDMLDALVAVLPAQNEEPEELSADLSVAIVGKPNAGKSTLLNALVGEERAIVSDIPGTTRDTVDSFIDFEGQRIKLIDTAGLRRRGKIEPGVEKYSAIRSVRAIERAEVVLLVIDATTGITAQDAHIAGYVQDAWKSAVILVNKWDAVDKDSYSMDQYTRNIRHVLKFIDYAPMLFISAMNGQRVKEVLPLAAKVGSERMVKLSTSQVNRVLEDAQAHQPAPNRAGRSLRIYYGTQVRSDPPTFLLYCNDPKLLHFTYERFLENRIRETYGFVGTPIRIVAKQRE